MGNEEMGKVCEDKSECEHENTRLWFWFESAALWELLHVLEWCGINLFKLFKCATQPVQHLLTLQPISFSQYDNEFEW